MIIAIVMAVFLCLAISFSFSKVEAFAVRSLIPLPQELAALKMCT